MKIEEENLEKILRDRTLFRESFKGNYFDDSPCAGLNIRVDNFGRIEYIGNHEPANYTLRVCFIKDGDVFYTKIEGIYRNIVKNGITRITKVDEPSNRAEEILLKTAELYNERKR